jgi:hypothetical protein
MKTILIIIILSQLLLSSHCYHGYVKIYNYSGQPDKLEERIMSFDYLTGKAIFTEKNAPVFNDIIASAFEYRVDDGVRYFDFYVFRDDLKSLTEPHTSFQLSGTYSSDLAGCESFITDDFKNTPGAEDKWNIGSCKEYGVRHYKVAAIYRRKQNGGRLKRKH